jgi:hypothetical protein
MKKTQTQKIQNNKHEIILYKIARYQDNQN